MYRWHKGLEKLEIPAQRVIRLQRSLSDVLVAHPGFPAQEATAYLCVFSSGQGVRAALALHLKTSQQLVFYLNEDGEVPQGQVKRLVEEGNRFAESMGFLLTEMDLSQRNAAAREEVWNSFPLKAGVEPPPVAPPEAPKPSPQEGEPAGPASVAAPAGQGQPKMPAAGGKEALVLTPEELARRRQSLLEKLGRLLASL